MQVEQPASKQSSATPVAPRGSAPGTHAARLQTACDAIAYTRPIVHETTQALLAAMGAKDHFTRGHSLRVARYSDVLAQRMGFDPLGRAELRVGALLHDVGKLGIPDEVLCRPGPLRRDEYVIIRRHPVLGHRILRPASVFRDILPLVLHHHEHWNGGGYPAGLVGDAIPQGARILSVADAMDAMLAKRSYQPSRRLKDVRTELLRCRSSQFDPQIVDVAVTWIDECVRAADRSRPAKPA